MQSDELLYVRWHGQANRTVTVDGNQHAQTGNLASGHQLQYDGTNTDRPQVGHIELWPRRPIWFPCAGRNETARGDALHTLQSRRVGFGWCACALMRR